MTFLLHPLLGGCQGQVLGAFPPGKQFYTMLLRWGRGITICNAPCMERGKWGIHAINKKHFAIHAREGTKRGCLHIIPVPSKREEMKEEMCMHYKCTNAKSQRGH